MRFDLLLIEDSPADARLIREMLGEVHGDQYAVDHVDRLSTAVEQLASRHVDAVLLDLMLPDSSFALQTVREALRSAGNVPLIVLSGLNHEAFAYQALSEGAQDYLVKGQIDASTLIRAIRHSIARHNLQSTIRDLALIDELTGLHTRRSFLLLADQQLRLAERGSRSISVVVIDVDGLKIINDTFGHLEGDRALMETASLLRRCFRQSDAIGRLGGDEFAALIAQDTDTSMEWVRERIIREQQSANQRLNRPYQISVSTGMVCCKSAQFPPLEELIAAADRNMYEQKRDPSRNLSPSRPAGSASATPSPRRPTHARRAKPVLSNP